MKHCFKIIFAMLVLAGCTPDSVNQARGDLNVFYQSSAKYADKSISCDSQSYGDHWFIYCESDIASQSHGSMFMVDAGQRGGYRLYTMNAAARRAASYAFRLPVADLPAKYRKRYSAEKIKKHI